MNNWKNILKYNIRNRRISPYLQAAANLLTDEWMDVDTFYDRTLDLKQSNNRPYKDTLGKSSLVNKLLKLGLVETERKGKGLHFIRRKQSE